MGCFGADNSVDDEATSKENLDKKYGEPIKYDPTFKGPIKKRGCTDIICCFFFFVCIFALLVTGYFAYTYGDPAILIYPTDSSGSICGHGKKESTPYLFFFDMLECARMGPAVFVKGCPTPQVCVSKCPSKSWVFSYASSVETTSGFSLSARSQMICKTGVDPTTGKYASMSVSDLVTKDYCAPYYVDSTAFVGRCVPSIFKQIVDMSSMLVARFGNTNYTLVTKNSTGVTGGELDKGTKFLSIFMSAVSVMEAIFADCSTSWWMMLLGVLLSGVVCLIYILAMRWFVGMIVWISLLFFVLLFAFSTIYCFCKYHKLLSEPSSNGAFTFTTNFSYYLGLRDTWLAFGILSTIFLIIILVLVIFLRKKIAIAVAIMKETSKAIGHMMFALIWPLWPLLLQLAVFGYWGTVAVYLAATVSANFQYSDTSNVTNENLFQVIPCDPTKHSNDTATSVCRFVKYGTKDYVVYLQLFNLFMLFWLANFVVALGQMTLAGSFSSYYWAFTKPTDIPASPLTQSLWRSLRYHIGSMAFGALIVAIVQVIRAILEYIDKKLKGVQNGVAQFILKCMKCCFWCLEKFLKFINKNAYIMISVYGQNFCTSAHQAFSLVMRNIVRTVVVDKVTDFILLISKLVVVGACGSAAYFFFDGQIPYLKNFTPSLNYYFIPVIVIILGAFVIATCFFSVYSMGVDTIYLCFLEDLERHDGTPDKPYYMSKNLMEILGKKNTACTQQKVETQEKSETQQMTEIQTIKTEENVF